MSPEFSALLKDLISSTEAARRYGITNDHISRLCRRAHVRGFLVGRLWYIDERSLRVYMARIRRLTLERRHELSERFHKARTTAI